MQITPRHLAQHTSGLPRLPKGMLWPAILHPYTPDPYAGCTTEFLLQRLARTTLRNTPGELSRYSNLGAGLLGLALATRTGTDYETLIMNTICQPLGMHDTRIARRRPARPFHPGTPRP